jgi:hypothetical protein
MTGLKRVSALAAAGMVAGLFSAAPQQADAAMVTIGVQSFAKGAIASAQSAQNVFHVGSALVASENFESFAATPSTAAGGSPATPGTTNPVATTTVGTFSSIITGGNATCVDSCVTPKTDLQIRSAVHPATNFGRYNTSDGAGDANFLDSNDNVGIYWAVPGTATIAPFDRISFLATDIDDVGTVAFRITASGSQITTDMLTFPAPKRSGGNGMIDLFTFVFSAPVTALNVEMLVGGNDGFGLDSFKISAVPLPAAGFLLLGGLGGLGFVSRHRKVA